MAVSGSPVATRYTMEFVTRSLPRSATDVLEIGCGTGELAAIMAKSGLKIDAIDPDESCVAEARARGVSARLGSWPDDVEKRYDAILFTRSLHHIHDLGGAVSAAAAAVRDNGRIIVEDFRAEGGSGRSRTWFGDMVESLFGNQAEVEALLAKAAPGSGDHDLHASSAIAEALVRTGEVRSEEAAYYFRYVEAAFGSEEIAQSVLEQELSLIASGAIDALGKRFVLSPRR